MPALRFAEFGRGQPATNTRNATHVLCEHYNDIATGSFDRELDRRDRTYLVLVANRC